MRIFSNLFFSILCAIIMVSCSKDSDNEPDPVVVVPPKPEPPVKIVDAKIISYSSNFGKTNDQITITGENFSNKVEDINLYFDSTKATIISATSTEIKFVLPVTDNVIPQLKLSIVNTTITNTVKNAYQGNIAILKANPASSWIVSNSPTTNTRILKIQILDNGAVYYNYEISTPLQQGGTISYNYVQRSLDDGKTWETWTETASTSWSTNFYATNNDEGWSVYGSNRLNKIPIGGNDRSLIANTLGEFAHMYVNESLNSGIVVNKRGSVYTTDDGKTFSNVFTASAGNDGWFYGTTYLDSDHIWCFGNIGSTVDKVFGYRPYIIYKKGASETWKEKSFLDMGKDVSIIDMQFFKDNSGLLLMQTLTNAKILRSSDGGDNWNEIYSGEKFTDMTFSDVNNGWAVLGKMLYKTNDGGVSWSLDYTHDEEILEIASKNKVIWAFSKTKILKRYI